LSASSRTGRFRNRVRSGMLTIAPPVYSVASPASAAFQSQLQHPHHSRWRYAGSRKFDLYRTLNRGPDR
jgi:hypothetical protein